MKHSQWTIDPASLAILDLPISPNIRRIVIVTEGRLEASSAVPAAGDCKLLLRQIGNVTIGTSIHIGGKVRLVAHVVPSSLMYWSFRDPRGHLPCDAVLPASLLSRTQTPIGSNRTASRRISALLSQGELGEAIGEFADVWMSGRDPGRIEATSLILRYLATHPLHRPNLLGAVAAALCST